MKKVLKVLGMLIALAVLLLAAGAAYIHFDGIPTYEVKAPDLKVTADSTMVAEGKRLATMVCSKCHMASNGLLEGQHMKDLPAQFGKAWSANITRDPKYGTGRYTDGELAYLLRTGIKRDGSYAPPWMPKFPHLSDYDLHSVIAYLRSDAPELAPVAKAQPPSQPSFLAKFLAHVAFKPLPYPSGPIEAPPVTDKVAFGKYMSTGKVECFSCHSPSFETTNVMEPEKTPGYFSGGNGMPDKEGTIIYTRNLTPDKTTGIGSWTEDQFIKAVRFGQRDGKPALRYPMEPFPAMTDEEASAIWAYLQTIPAISHDVDALYKK
ncbi:MAG: c-type cytochrome [Saprospiraceae bacterium]|nr:c-type cytochrome [Candidatus Opimibacter iunctus]